MRYSEKTIPLFCLLAVACFFVSCTADDDATVRIARFKGDKTCAISYTYDDGMKEHYTLVAPEMEKRNFYGTFWVNGNAVGSDAYYATWPELKEMARAGHEISNHSWSHANLTQITHDEVRVEIAKNDSIIFAETGMPSYTFCYPYNAMNDTVIQIAAENRVGTRLTQYAIGTASTPEKLSEWVNGLLKTAGWGIAMIHGITSGYDAFTSDSILWNHFDEVAAQQEQIWVGTFREVAAYEKERESISLNIQKKKRYWLITPSLELDKDLFYERLTLVIDKDNIKTAIAKQDDEDLPVKILPEKIMFDFNPYGGRIKVQLK
ncbi:MAG: polysaccharide deacetylase family protein [Tannerella sp.]|jgi:peptidoglycan/xylan/chitin deacetylase (PgdA/CDA1 family)|nr:polysaccharide deacetylase family protein [Tannerella sp.]